MHAFPIEDLKPMVTLIITDDAATAGALDALATVRQLPVNIIHSDWDATFPAYLHRWLTEPRLPPFPSCIFLDLDHGQGRRIFDELMPLLYRVPLILLSETAPTATDRAFPIWLQKPIGTQAMDLLADICRLWDELLIRPGAH